MAPVGPLKTLQRRLSQILNLAYRTKSPVHGFVLHKNIVTNAASHVRQRVVLNLDLEDFFPSLNFGRVRGMFMSPPYSVPAPAATALAQLCCHNNQLPQGAPTSPIISNMILARLDSELLALAMQNRSVYTRYADDLTFSTSSPRGLNDGIAVFDPATGTRVGHRLRDLIESNGFRINEEKVRVQLWHGRQEVTGLTVNRFPNVTRRFTNQLRAMIHDADIHGPVAAQERFNTEFDKRLRANGQHPLFESVIAGRLAFLRMVIGPNHPRLMTLSRRFRQVFPTEESIQQPGVLAPMPAPPKLRARVFTEGKTDWMHLEFALSMLQRDGRFPDLALTFHKDSESLGDKELLTMLRTYSRLPRQAVPTLFVFDSDVSSTLKEAVGQGALFKHYGEGVTAAVLPTPGHRQNEHGICIELLYNDADLTRYDDAGRRLYLNSEFHKTTGRHLADPSLNTLELNKVKADAISVVDKAVFDEENQNIALSKADFAQLVTGSHANFLDVDLSEFTAVFELLIDALRSQLPN